MSRLRIQDFLSLKIKILKITKSNLRLFESEDSTLKKV